MSATITLHPGFGYRFLREEGGRIRNNRVAPARANTRGRRAPEARREHESVLVKEVIEQLSPQDGDIVLDATGGAGGHSEALLCAAAIRLMTLDADPQAVENIRVRLMPFGKRAQVIEGNFADISETLAKAGVSRIDKALFDLGWNRQQLYAGRGFSFQEDEPLVMSYGTTPASGFTAKEILNTWSEEAIANALFGYGEERYARRIARAVIEARRARPIETTGEFIELIARAVPAAYRRGKMHFATRSFQAMRIAVNDELGTLDRGLRAAWEALAPGGRIAVITFHSIEDRAVKRLFNELSAEGGSRITKKPIVPSAEEVRRNPSSRSAKLRVISKN